MKKESGVIVLISSRKHDAFSLPQIIPPSLTPSALVRSHILVLPTSALGMASSRHRFQFHCFARQSSDKLQDASDVGASGAATLLQRYGTLEAALAAGRFPTQDEGLRLFKSIATMNRKAPLPSLRSQKPTWGKAAALAYKWELNQLAGRLEELASKS